MCFTYFTLSGWIFVIVENCLWGSRNTASLRFAHIFILNFSSVYNLIIHFIDNLQVFHVFGQSEALVLLSFTFVFHCVSHSCHFRFLASLTSNILYGGNIA